MLLRKPFPLPQTAFILTLLLTLGTIHSSALRASDQAAPPPPAAVAPASAQPISLDSAVPPTPPTKKMGPAKPIGPAKSNPDHPKEKEKHDSAEKSGVSPVLESNAEGVGSSNVVRSLHGNPRQKQLAAYQTQLQAAKQLRWEKSAPQATQKLATLVEDPETPDDIRRQALLELALAAQDERQLPRAQQIFAQFTHRYPDDPSVPEIYYRQGLLFREMGANQSALNKFFAAMNSSLQVKYEQLDYYEGLVLHAQNEIAETYFMQGEFAEAASYFERLLKLEDPNLARSLVQYKLLFCYVNLGLHEKGIWQARDYLTKHLGAPEEPEVRYLLASTLKKKGDDANALEQVFILLQAQSKSSEEGMEEQRSWRYWQQKAGNEIANQFYREGSFQKALQIYSQLALMNPDPTWQIPAWYQVGLAFESLKQPFKAQEAYGKILSKEAELKTNSLTPSLTMLIDMARWRTGYLAWQTNAEIATRDLHLRLPALSTNTLASLPANEPKP